VAKDQRVKDNNDYRMKTYHRFPTMADLAHQVKRLMLQPTFLRDVGLTLKNILKTSIISAALLWRTNPMTRNVDKRRAQNKTDGPSVIGQPNT